MDGLARATLRSVAGEVAEGLTELCERIVGVIVALEAPYGPRGIVVIGDLRGTVRANLTGMLAVLAGTGSVGDGELSVPRSTGRRRAQQAVPLEAVLRAYSLAGQSLMGALLARAHELYKALLGPAEDLIRGKRLLIVPSGPLTLICPMRLPVFGPSPRRTISSSCHNVPSNSTTDAPASRCFKAFVMPAQLGM